MCGTPSIALGSACPWKWMPVDSAMLLVNMARTRSPSVTVSRGPGHVPLKPSASTGSLFASIWCSISSTVMIEDLDVAVDLRLERLVARRPRETRPRRRGSGRRPPWPWRRGPSAGRHSRRRTVRASRGPCSAPRSRPGPWQPPKGRAARHSPPARVTARVRMSTRHRSPGHMRRGRWLRDRLRSRLHRGGTPDATAQRDRWGRLPGRRSAQVCRAQGSPLVSSWGGTGVRAPVRMRRLPREAGRRGRGTARGG